MYNGKKSRKARRLHRRRAMGGKRMKRFKFASRMDRMESKEMKEILEMAAVPGLISFAGGLPAPELFPVEAMKASAVAVMDEMGRKALQYNDPVGHDPLREWIAERMETVGVKTTKEEILVTSGSQQGIDFAGKIFLEKGDVVLCESPSYLGAINALGAYECDFVEVPTDGEGMEMEALKALVEERDRIKLVYVIPEFQNPTGKSWSVERRKAFMDLVERYDLTVLEDNPYGELRYEGVTPPSLKSMDTGGRVVYLGTFSKILSPGIRVGWVCAGAEIMDKFVKVKQRSDVHTNSVTQMEVCHFLSHNDIDEHIDALRALYGKRRDLMLEAIRENFPEEVTVTHPEGGLFLWAVLPDGLDAKAMLERAVARNVGYVPGGAFFPNGGNRNTLRLNFSNMREDRIEEGIRILGEVIREEMTLQG